MRICFNIYRLHWELLSFGVVAIEIALALTDEVHALPSSFAQKTRVRGREAELSPVPFPENVNVVRTAEDNNVVLPGSELLALIGRGRIRDSFPVHFLHLSVADTGFREKHPCFYSIMWPAVATTHPSSLCGAGIVQYLHTGIYVNAFGRSLAGVSNTDIGTQRLTLVNNNSGVRLFRLIHEVDSEPGSFIGLRSAELLIVDDHSQSGDHEHKNISKELKPFYPSRLIGLSFEITLPELTRRTVGLLFLVGAASCFLYAQIIPFRRLRRRPMVGIAIGIVLLVLGFLCVAQFYNLVLR